MKVQVTVEMEFNKLPDDEARALARQLVEARGLNVSKVSVKAETGRVKQFVPKAGKPGSVLVRDGVAYTVWGESDVKGGPWATREGSSMYYRITDGGALPYHPDGEPCQTWMRDGCPHSSHKLAAVS